MSAVRVISETTRTSRGAVRCNLCLRRIDKGERYEESANVFDGRAYRWRECSHCAAFVKLTALGDYLLDQDDGYGSDNVGEFEPTTRYECVLKSQWNRGWRNYDGKPALLRRPEYRAFYSNRLRPTDDCPLVPVPALH